MQRAVKTLATLARRWFSRALATWSMVACSGCQSTSAKSPVPSLNTETHPACQRLHELLKAEEWRVTVELPSVALLLSRSVQSPPVSACSEQLVNWLRPSLEARPIELTKSLEPRIAALAALSSVAWNESAIQILIRLMDVDIRQALVDWEERSTVGGMGTSEIALGRFPIVSLEQFKTWTAAALVRAHVGRRVGPAYADLLVRHFANLPAESVQAPARAPVTSLLWPELVRAFELAPNEPRWAGLPTYWQAPLQALRTSGSR